jgi:hypothetical protein
MKFKNIIFTLLLVLTWIVVVPAQEAASEHAPPGITVRKYKWEQVGPGPSVDQSWKAESDAASSTLSSEESSTFAVNRRPFFVYSLELQNGGSKVIKAIRWAYIILDSKSSKELGNHDFENYERVGINKAKSLSAKSPVLPTKVFPIPVTDKASLTERVVLRCVLYQDGSLWQHPETTAPECDAMRRRAEN